MQEMTSSSPTGRSARRWRRAALEAGAFSVAAVLVATSAVLVKRADVGPALAAVERTGSEPAADASPDRQAADRPLALFMASVDRSLIEDAPGSASRVDVNRVRELMPPAASDEAALLPAGGDATAAAGAVEIEAIDVPDELLANPGLVRFFDGRPVRPVRTLWMTVTAYSPDERSCGIWADGVTASNKTIWTNAMQLVAADTSILPFGTLLSLDEYAGGDIVPVLDRGGAIKGMRLDVLYATHAEAMRFGVKRVPVTVWEYADE
jgi:3D (Asp-Asp-Asp) domain-containing protein